ncbi:MAG: peptidoglycan DL-endopeptidase CwlO [Miltoncostaeaceae bacterium]|jgi:cell wall-associated NlpC family hydrolase|nr:peptidoglycan DL-endopeptidase CwlO [Miltoncostaeaceae bacterium]
MLVVVLAALGLAALGVTLAPAQPGTIQGKRAQVAQLQAQLAAVDAQVERAVEAYNGARYRLSVISDRIVENRRLLVRAKRDLLASQIILSKRLRIIYREGEPTLAEVLLSSSSFSAVVSKLDTLSQIAREDGRVVQNVRDFRGRTIAARKALIVDRAHARVEVSNRAQERDRVAALLRQRRAVLDSAQADLRRALEAEQARQRAAALAARQRLLQAQEVPSAGTPSEPLLGPLPSGDGNAAAASIAMRYLGVPYVWGGASPSGFDCSGLASYVYAQIGKSVPHYTGAIYGAFPHVPSDQLQAGDLVFFNGLGHMGIYLGNGQYVHAPHTGDVVRVASMSGRSDYVGAVRP